MIAFLKKTYELIAVSKRKKLPVFFLYSFGNTLLDFISITYLMPVILLVVDRQKLNQLALDFFGIVLTNKVILLLFGSLLCFFILKNIVQTRLIQLQSGFIYGISAELSGELMTQHLNQDYPIGSNSDKSALLRDIFQLPMAFSSSILLPIYTLFSESVILIFVLFVGIIWNPIVTLSATAALVFLMAIVLKTRNKKTDHFNKTIVTLYQETLKNMMNIFHGFLEIKTGQSEQEFGAKFKDSNAAHYEQLARLSAFKQTNSRYLETLFIAMLSLGIFYLIAHENNLRDLLALAFFAGAAIKIIPSFHKIIGSYTDIRANRNIVDILSTYDRKTSQKKQVLPAFENNISVENISYRHKKKDVIQQLDFKIRKGDFIALSGHSGAGKTTFLQLICGLLRPDTGTLNIDGHSLSNGQIPGFMSYVSQQPFLFQGTLLENITMLSDKNPDDAFLSEILEKLDLADWVTSLPNRLDTILLLETKSLSGGQKQRIALARALYFKPQLLVLDEATNQLDADLEYRIFSYLKTLVQTENLTVLAVSHGKKIEQFADKKIVLENGSLKENA